MPGLVPPGDRCLITERSGGAGEGAGHRILNSGGREPSARPGRKVRSRDSSPGGEPPLGPRAPAVSLLPRRVTGLKAPLAADREVYVNQPGGHGSDHQEGTNGLPRRNTLAIKDLEGVSERPSQTRKLRIVEQHDFSKKLSAKNSSFKRCLGGTAPARRGLHHHRRFDDAVRDPHPPVTRRRVHAKGEDPPNP